MFLRDNSQIKFAVVEFLNEKTLEVVPIKWVTKVKADIWCFWPSDPGVRKLVIDQAEPQASWKKYRVKIVREKESRDKAEKSCQKILRAQNSEIDTSEPDIETRKKNNPKDSQKQKKVSEPPQGFNFNFTSPSSIKNSGSEIPQLVSNEVIISSSPISHGNQVHTNPSSSSAVFTIESPGFASTPKSSHKSSNEDTSFQALVLRQLQEIKISVKNIEKVVGTLGAEQIESLAIDLPKLPLEVEQELTEVELWLQQRENFNKLRKYFSLIGGSDWKDTTKRICARTIGGELESTINFTGKNKIAFKDKRLASCIIGAVRSSYKHLSEKEIEGTIAAWLRGYPDRHGGREKRRKLFAADTSEGDQEGSG